MVARALRSDVSLMLSEGTYVTSGDGLRIGGREYRMDLTSDRKKGFRASSLLLLVAVAIGLGALAYLPVPSSAPLRTSAPGGRSEPDIEGVFRVDVSAAVEEARAHLKQGRPEQARLVLIEASERSPGRSEWDSLLEATRRSRDPAPREDSDENARELYEEGLAHMERGDAVAAGRMFDRALDEMEGSGERAPFAAALERARIQAAREVERKTKVRVARAQRLIDESGSGSAAVAVERIAMSIREAEAALRANPRSPAARDVELKARRALAAAADRWLASAMEVERLSGCGRAAGMYDRMCSLLEGVDDEAASRARRHLALCGGEGGEG